MHGEDSSEFALIDAEHLGECSPSSTKEDGVKLAVVLEKYPYTFWDGKDGVAMGDVLLRSVPLIRMEIPFRITPKAQRTLMVMAH